jgi:hypothetical protein
MKYRLHDLQALETINSEPAHIILRIEALRTNYYIYKNNYLAFTSYLQELEDPIISIEYWKHGNEDTLAEKLREVIRLLHNYEAGVKTCIDLTRCFVNTYYLDTEFMNKYQKEVDSRFLNNPLAGFVEELRNYMLHYDLPFSIAKIIGENVVYFGKAPEKHIIYLYRDDLIEWKSWKKGMLFLGNASPKMGLLKLINDYNTEIESFYAWIFNELGILHNNEIKWYYAKFGELLLELTESK